LNTKSTYGELSDAVFVKGCIVGATSSAVQAWYEFYRRFFEKFRDVFRRFKSIPDAVANDLCQEAFIKFSWAAQGGLIRDYGKLDFYLESIALNEARDYFRKLKRKRRLFPEDKDPESMDIPIHDSPLDRMITREIADALRSNDFFSRLSKREYEVFQGLVAHRSGEKNRPLPGFTRGNYYTIRSRLKKKILKFIEEL